MANLDTPRGLVKKALSVLKRSLRHAETDSPQVHETEQPIVDVLFVNGCDLDTLRRYRVEHQREQLELYGLSTSEVHYTAVAPSDAQRARTFVIYRCPITDSVRAFIDEAHRQNKIVLFDVDDLVISTSYTDELPVVQAMKPEEKAVFDDGVTRTGETLKLCDGAIVTTERLATELSKVVPDVFINRNVASQAMVSHSNRAYESYAPSCSDTVSLGYFSGSMTHNSDFLVLLPALVEIMKTHPNVVLKTVGDLELPQELSSFADRISSAPYVSWEELPELIRSADINLAPLEATLFNEAKSENKWTEASLVGVPTIASKVGSFERCIEHGETGYLCRSTEEWVNTLSLLIENQQLRTTIGVNARAHCLLTHTTLATGWHLAAHLSDRARTISSLTPAHASARASLVATYLNSRGLLEYGTSINPAPWEKLSLDDRLSYVKKAHEQGKQVLVTIYEQASGDTATFRYFGYNVAQQLHTSSKWESTFVFVEELDHARELLARASALLLIRCRVRPELVTLATWAKASGKPVGYLIDDDALGARTAPTIIDLMAHDPSSQFERDFWKGVTIRFKLASDLADCLIVPNQFFADMLSRYSDKPRCVIHSFLNEEQVKLSEAIVEQKGHSARPDDVFTIGYFSGTMSHQDDFNLVKEPLLTFLAKHHDARLLLGGSFELDGDLFAALEQGRLILMPSVDYATLQYLQASVDIVLAPLVESEFSNCKSALKVFEAGVVRTPACASPTAGYKEAILQGTTGFLCSTPAEWSAALERLYLDRRLLASLGEEARSYALSNRYGAHVTAEIESACDTLLKSECLPIPEEIGKALASKTISNWDDPFETNPAFAKDA